MLVHQLSMHLVFLLVILVEWFLESNEGGMRAVESLCRDTHQLFN